MKTQTQSAVDRAIARANRNPTIKQMNPIGTAMSNSGSKPKSSSRKQGFKDAAKSAKAQLQDVLAAITAAGGTAASAAGGDIIGAVKNLANAGKAGGKLIKDFGKGLDAARRMLFNHPEWYTNYNLSNLVNLNFGRRKTLGATLEALMGGTDPYEKGNELTSVGVIPVELVMSKDSLDSIQQAVSIMYSKIRSANSGSVNFTQNELLAYVLNIRSIRACIAMLNRAIGLSNYVNVYDSDLPKLLTSLALHCTALEGSSAYRGISFDTLLANKANLVNYVNTWTRTLRALYPLNIPLFDRTDWMFSNVFRDSDDAKSNYWLFVLDSVPFYTVGSNNVITRNNREFFPLTTSSPATYTGLLTVINTLFKDMASNEVNTIIAGDILKAYGEQMLYNQWVITSDYILEPIYDEAALTQIQNASILGGTDSNPVAESISATGVHTITVTREGSTDDITKFNLPNRIINTYKDSVSAGEVISYTRLAAIGKVSSNTLTITTCGFEVVREVQFVYGYKAQNNMQYPLIATTNDIDVNSQGANQTIQAIIVNAWTILDWAPLIMVPFATGATPAWMWDVNNFAVAVTEDIDNFNQIATLSLLFTPEFVKRQNQMTLDIK